jgi:hypothetical protein
MRHGSANCNPTETDVEKLNAESRNPKQPQVRPDSINGRALLPRRPNLPEDSARHRTPEKSLAKSRGKFQLVIEETIGAVMKKARACCTRTRQLNTMGHGHR